jgi:hypothetical protein
MSFPSNAGSAKEAGGRGPGAHRLRASTQADCDAIQAEARRVDGRPSILRAVPVPRLEPTTDLIETRLAEEIAFTRRMLEALSDQLSSDPLLLQRHPHSLQSFDIIGQTLSHLATVIGASDKAAAISRIGMQDLKARLARPSGPITPLGTRR